MRVAAIVPSAGRGSRLKSKISKPLVRIFGRPLLAYTLERLVQAFPFTEVVVAAAPSQIKKIERLGQSLRLKKQIRVVAGGKTRAQSVRNAVQSLENHCDYVLVHDAARPLVSAVAIHKLLRAVSETGAAILALEATATVKKVRTRDKTIQTTEDRERLYLAQTPQVFRRNLLKRRYRELGTRALRATDEAALFDGTGVRVKIVDGDPKNIKITTKDDLELMKFYESRHRIRHPRA